MISQIYVAVPFEATVAHSVGTDTLQMIKCHKNAWVYGHD